MDGIVTTSGPQLVQDDDLALPDRVGEIAASGAPARGVSLLGIPLGGGAAHPGTACGPAELRAAGLAGALTAAGCTVADCGDVFVLPSAAMATGLACGVRNGAVLRSWICAISSHAYELAASGTVPVFLGGDHSLSIGTINGVGRFWERAGRPLFVVWIDGYADCEIPSTTRSGNLQAMAAAAVLGEPELKGLFAGGPQIAIAPDRFVPIGQRWIDAAEQAWLDRRGIAAITMADLVDGRGLRALDALLDRVAACGGVIHASIDVAVLGAAAPSIARGAEPPRRRGACLRGVMERLARSKLVVSAELVELNPALDERPLSSGGAADLLVALLGEPPARGRI
ncbi:MAG: arginase family protein [Xanthobacteraceae bacterium]|nr:arginase family protein [Xanthobacteraceae bacterium]